MLRLIDMLVVHAAATPARMNIGRTEIREWHLERGFSDIGYHYVIRRNGDLEMGRPMRRPGAHAKGWNMHSLGICMVGGMNDAMTRAENNFTDAQFTTLSVLLEGLMETFDLNHGDVYGHCDLPLVRKECPCFDVSSWLREYMI